MDNEHVDGLRLLVGETINRLTNLAENLEAKNDVEWAQAGNMAIANWLREAVRHLTEQRDKIAHFVNPDTLPRSLDDATMREWDLSAEIDRLKRGMDAYACKKAGIAGNDPSGIERLIWYRTDGWDHGGLAMTWRERAEELAARNKELEGALERLLMANARAEVYGREYKGFNETTKKFGGPEGEFMDAVDEAEKVLEG